MTIKVQQNNKADGKYEFINGLKMYYEIHGTGTCTNKDTGSIIPLVLLHGGLSTIDLDFGRVLPSFAKTRRVIAIEQQAHGHTADVDRPLTIKQMAEDTVALLQQLKIKKADFFGYSMGAGIALEIAIRNPDLVNKLVLASIAYNKEGFHPGLLEGIGNLKVEDMAGSPFQETYAKTAPNPEDWPKLVNKISVLNRQTPNWPPEDIKSLHVPTLLLIGDSDVIRPEHAVSMFRLLGGGVAGDIAGLPSSQLAVLPGTTHITLVERADWLLSMISQFLSAPTSG